MSKALRELEHGNVCSPCKEKLIMYVYKFQLLCLLVSWRASGPLERYLWFLASASWWHFLTLYFCMPLPHRILERGISFTQCSFAIEKCKFILSFCSSQFILGDAWRTPMLTKPPDILQRVVGQLPCFVSTGRESPELLAGSWDEMDTSACLACRGFAYFRLSLPTTEMPWRL